MLLQVEHLDVTYGDVRVIWNLNMEVNTGEIVAVVGSNGAGKTTLLKAVSGILNPLAGRITYLQEDITFSPPSERVRKGIAHIPEGRKLFAGMTVRENVMMGAYTRTDRDGIMSDLKWIWDLFPELTKRTKQQAGTLSGGEQQMCAIARGLMSKPRLLLIDELSLGLAPVVVDRLSDLVRRIHKEASVAVVFVEQDVQLAFDLADRGYVIETGRVVREGPSSTLGCDPIIRQAYVGL